MHIVSRKKDVIRTDTLALLTFRTYTIHIANGFPISQWYTEKKTVYEYYGNKT